MVRDELIWEYELTARSERESDEEKNLEIERSKILPDELE